MPPKAPLKASPGRPPAAGGGRPGPRGPGPNSPLAPQGPPPPGPPGGGMRGPPRGPPGPPGTPPAGRPLSPPVARPPGTPMTPPPGALVPVGGPYGTPMRPPPGSPTSPLPAAIFTDQETLNRQFEQFDQSHQAIRDFFLREDQLLGLERRKFEEWKQAQQAWLDKQNMEVAERQAETKRYEEDLHQLERDIQTRERSVQKQQQAFQANQRQLQLAQQQHAQQMTQNQKLIKQQQDQLAAAQSNQTQQMSQLQHQEQAQAHAEAQMQQQRMLQMEKRDALASVAAFNQQQAAQLQHAAQHEQAKRRADNFTPLLKANTGPVASPGPGGPGTVFGGRQFNPGPIHTYLQDREEPKSPNIRQIVGPLKWTDPDFRPDNSSLFFGPEPSPSDWGGAWGCQWIRATELFPQSALFKGDDGGPSGADIIQGGLGNMWFLNALSAVASNPNIVRNLVVAQYPEAGIFEFRFWKGGRWITVVIDDFLPVRQINGQGTSLGSAGEPFEPGTCELWCSRSSDPSELWVPLIEKAYAKLHGSYQCLNGGNSEYAMVDLTGGVAEHIGMNTESGRALMRCGGVQEKLKQAKAEGWLVGCVFKGTPVVYPGGGYAPGDNGLIPGRSYVVLDVRDLPGNKTVIRLRNPWGVGGWCGPWCNGESQWTPLDVGPHMATFWMELTDFEDSLAALQITRTYNFNIGDPFYLSADLDGYWGGMNVGGQVSMSNPQYIISAPEDAAAFVSLSQYDVQYQRQDRDVDVAPAYRKPHFPDPNPNLCCGVFILQCDNHTRMNNPTGNVLTKDIIKYASFVYGRQTGVEFRLDPGRSFCIMPCQFQPGLEAPYQLYVYATKPFAMRKTLGEGAEQPMPVFTIQFSTPPPGIKWDPGYRARVIVERQPKGEVLEEDPEKR